ncbi:MAG: DUF423 domain-containing protein [Ignavibacteriae bacterium]|nr:MAG: DUF423 domain-containing protein [Ignavibacteriota bacterium]
MGYRIIISAGISGALAVALGAMAAHALKDQLDVYALEIYTKAATYHMYHALALFGVGILAMNRPSKQLRFAAIALIVGTLLFSGSLYALALTGIRQLGMITPFGGVAFIVGWMLLAWSALANRSS